MTSTVSKLLLSASYGLLLLSPVLEAAKTITLNLIDESETFHKRSLLRRQDGAGWRSTDIIYNTTDYQFYVEVNIGDGSRSLKLAVIQNPYTWVASRWNSTRDCPPLTDDYTCGRVQSSGFFNLDPPDSSTYQNLSSDFDITYADNRYAIGNWGRDRFRLGQLSIEDVNFGIAEFYNATPALGLERSDSTIKYPTFLEVMQEKELINTPTYGIYLGDFRSKQDSGKSITFGGLDRAKFGCPLKTYSSLSSYALDLLSIEVVSDENVVIAKPLDQPETSPIVASLNFGTASIHLPPDVFDIVMNDLGALERNNYDIPNLPPVGSGLNFTFTEGLSIFVPYSQMITQNPRTSWYTVLIVPNPRRTVLGTPFFRSAYVFYDFQNSEFSVAPALYNVTASNVTEIGIDKASVRSHDWICAIQSETPSPSPFPSPTPNPDGGSKTNIAAIAGGAAGGGVLLIAVIVGVSYYIFAYRPRHSGAAAAPDMPPDRPMEDAPGGGGFGGAVAQNAGHHGGFVNDQFSPTKPTHFSPVTSPISELSPEPWGGRHENAAPHFHGHGGGVHVNPNVHEMA